MVKGVEQVAQQGVRLAVLPETANMSYIFDDFAMVKPYLDTVPGKTTEALSKVANKYHMFTVVGLGELDTSSGLEVCLLVKATSSKRSSSHVTYRSY